MPCVPASSSLSRSPSPAVQAKPSAYASVASSPNMTDLRSKTSRSTIMTEGLWDNASQRKRWSMWTADTERSMEGEDLSALGLEHDNGLKLASGSAPETSSAAASRSGQGTSAEYSLSLASGDGPSSRGGSGSSSAADADEWYGDDYAQGLRRRRSQDPLRSPPSPTSEAALDAALSSTMLALTTANSLLLSTMSSRRELARLRGLQNELENSLTRKEAELRRQLESNHRTTEWMERACQRLDDVLQGRSPREMAADDKDMDELAVIVSSLRPPPSNTTSAAPSGVPLLSSPRHSSSRSASYSAASGNAQGVQNDRGASVGQVSANDSLRAQGYVEAKDVGATIGKSAARRLESVLKRSSSQGLTSGPTSALSPSAAPVAGGSHLSSRPGSSISNTLGPTSEKRSLPGDVSSDIPPTKSSEQGIPNSLLRPAALQAPSAVVAGPTSTRRNYAHPSSPTVSSVSSKSNVPSVTGSNATPSSASSLLTAALGASRSAAPNRSLSPGLMQQEATTAGPQSQLLTPPMRGFGLAEEEQSNISTPSLLKRTSLSHLRSPSALRMMASAQGSGSSVTNAAHSWQGDNGDGEDGEQHSEGGVSSRRRKGALEALRRLNGGISQGIQGGSSSGAQDGDSKSGEGSADAAASTPGQHDCSDSVGWGGAFKSWMRLGGALESPSAQASDKNTSHSANQD